MPIFNRILNYTHLVPYPYVSITHYDIINYNFAIIFLLLAKGNLIVANISKFQCKHLCVRVSHPTHYMPIYDTLTCPYTTQYSVTA